jgi:hypothetical protein
VSVTNPVLYEVFDTIEKLYQPRAGPRQRGRPYSYREQAMLKAFVQSSPERCVIVHLQDVSVLRA